MRDIAEKIFATGTITINDQISLNHLLLSKPDIGCEEIRMLNKLCKQIQVGLIKVIDS